jgi:hypothetical protein
MRNPIGVRLFRVHVLGSGRRNGQGHKYYCQFCWDTIIQRATETYPQLTASPQSKSEKSSYAQQMGVLLGLRQSLPDHGAYEQSMLTTHDMQYKLSSACVVGGIPLAAFHPTGAELEAHIEEACRRFTPVGWE